MTLLIGSPRGDEQYESIIYKHSARLILFMASPSPGVPGAVATPQPLKLVRSAAEFSKFSVHSAEKTATLGESVFRFCIDEALSCHMSA